jgi:hypothetical protein
MPWIAIGLSVPLLLLPWTAGVRTHGDEHGIPLLTVLLMSEFGFVLTAVGAFAATRTIRKTGYRHTRAAGLLACFALAMGFLWALLRLYPAGV